MKKNELQILMLFTAALIGCQAEQDDSVVDVAQDSGLQTKEERMSYLLGYRDVEKFQNQGLSIDVDAFVDGAEAAIKDSEAVVSQQEGRELIAHFKNVLEQERLTKADENLARSEKFLAENRLKEGVITTESGLQYKVIREGDGESPKPENLYYLTDFETRLISGEVIDSSYAQDKKRNFGWNRVTKGWEEAMQLMKEGGKYEFYIPNDLAYGKDGYGQIGPNEVLIVTIELYDANYDPNAE